MVPLSLEVKQELQWWIDHMESWNGRAIFGSVSDMIIESDANKIGWGAQCGEYSTGGKWSAEESSLHINCLELLAGSFAIRALSPTASKCCILLQMDNVSAVRYVNKLGGARSQLLAELAREFWEYCLSRQLTVIAEHIPGKSNRAAD